MKKVVLSLIFIGITLMTFGQKKETRSVSDFTGIDASSVFDITVTKGSTESLTIEADEDALPYVRSEVKQGVLHLYLDNDKKVKNIKTLKATVVMKNLDKVSLSGACKLSAADLFTPENFSGNCSGATNLKVNVNTNQLSVKASGASGIQLKSKVSTDATFDMSGTSKIQVDLSCTKARFNTSGVSSVELTGSASEIKIGTSGTSNIKAGDFTVKSANIESSGTSNVTLDVTETLKVNSSGTSSIRYKGSPSIEANKSGASSINKI